MTLPHPDSVVAALSAHARAQPDGIALVFDGRATSFAELDAGTGRIAAGFLQAGIEAGERVAYLGRNTAAFFTLLYGAMKAGVVLVPINWRLAPFEVLAIVADSGARMLVLGREYIDDPVYAAVDGVDQVLAAEPHETAQTLAHWQGTQQDVACRPVTPADIALQLYTSGTTGQPKGVMLSHENLIVAHVEGRQHDLGWNQWDAGERALLAMPVSHIAGTGWGIGALLHGAACHILRQFDLDETFDAIEHHRITRLFLVPAALQMLVRHPRARRTDFSCLAAIGYGASPMPLALLRECIDTLKTPLVQFYGMTETAGTIVALPPADHRPDRPERMRAAGRALPWVELRIAGPDGTKQSPGMIGEILTRSRSNMAGYWARPEDTARTIDSDGWLHTGDAGSLDRDGYLFISDRIKDMVISGGENVYPAEVESLLSDHPAVAEIAVIGVPDERWGEAVHAVVVLRPDCAVSAEALIAWARSRIAGFKAPPGVTFADALPRNAAGKLLKRALREALRTEKTTGSGWGSEPQTPET